MANRVFDPAQRQLKIAVNFTSDSNGVKFKSNSNLSGLRFFVYCICIIMWHSHLNDMEIPETKRFIPKGFELGTTILI